MSQHEFNSQRYRITVGWDRPLCTFFASVFDEEAENEDEPLIWLGTQWGQYPDAYPFLEVLGKLIDEHGVTDVVLPNSLLLTLEHDKQSEG